MVRTIVKGGVWKNTEDEVLKAAIAKYGKNQWARISSLLTRKTPKQCKARWYEWLDPSIKKTEWSKTEDEKLLHLAKLMPTQWRTIAPLVGRTANQCLERYQKLLDEAQAKENEELGLTGTGDAGPSADDVRKLRPGEVDPDPETKPARPDPIDMDEDEKEMLSEARARLANTQGKKAKRKARERQLEEARRLAVLQKKRELKAAGIIMRSKTKKKGMDYNADIPFEKKPAPGFYDTSEEQARITAAPVGQSLRRLENKRKPDEEDAERKKRQRKSDNKEEPHQTKFIAARDAQIQKLKEAESIGRRRKLVLPNAQVGEAELEDIAKIGQAGENAKALVIGGSEASNLLLSGYEGLEAAKMARTPRTAPQHDNIMLEARNLRNMTIAQTPLLGDENAPMHLDPSGGSGFQSATPRHQVAYTPNPLATPRDPSNGSLVGATPLQTPLVGSTPLRTPLRDNLSINPADARSQESAAKRALKAGFMNLPQPENNFELLLPDEEEDANAEGTPQRPEDAADRDTRARLLQQQEVERALRRRSRPVRDGLPRPVNVELPQLFENLSLAPYRSQLDPNMLEVRDIVDQELASLVRHDTIQHPLPGTTTPGSTRSDYQYPDDDLMTQATDIVNAELASMVGFPDANPAQVRDGLVSLSRLEDEPTSSWFALAERLVWDIETKTWVPRDSLSLEQRIAGYQSQLTEARDIMTKEANKAVKMEKKLNITLGGYRKLGQTLGERLTSAFDHLQLCQLEHDAFSRLRSNEAVAGPRRAAALKEEVDRLEVREQRLQRRYAELVEEKRQWEVRISELEDKLMADAEAYNEAQLEAGEE